MGNNLTVEELKGMMDSLPYVPPVVGVACSPEAASLIRSSSAGYREAFLLTNPPILIDPRMRSERTELFYDREAWNARCREQDEWDSTP